MKRITLISLLVLCTAQVTSAQDWARATLEKSSRHREWVTVKHDGRSVETFVVYPESKGKTPVVLIIHEIFGMTDWVQDLAKISRSEEHTSELQSPCNLVCRLLLEKKK